MKPKDWGKTKMEDLKRKSFDPQISSMSFPNLWEFSKHA